MNVNILGGGLLCLAIAMLPATLLAKSPKPTCEEEPTRRDCIKVEDPHATPSKQTVNGKKPVQLPVVRPMPAAGQGAAGGAKGR